MSIEKTALLQHFSQVFQTNARYIFSAPGRTELGGNHTDHQHGCVLAAAVNLETVAAVAENGTRTVRIQSEGYPMCSVSLDELSVDPSLFGSTQALIRGVIAKFVQLGHEIRGFDAYVCSTVLPGSGLSSSAAFEVLIGTILNGLFHCGRTAVEIAQFGQYAENVYFGKPCGLMDQMASSVGNIISIDFARQDQPVITPIPFDFAASGHALCIIDSGADHADLTDAYAAIPGELKNVCHFFGKEYLRDIPEEEFYVNLPTLRPLVGDRAILRAIHVYVDNKRVQKQVEALNAGDFDAFLALVCASGQSSWMYLQNVIPAGNTQHQELALSLALAAHLLEGRGACRVHGGGFAGTIQAFVPNDLLERFRSGMEAVLGAGSCHVLSIRKDGGTMEVL